MSIGPFGKRHGLMAFGTVLVGLVLPIFFVGCGQRMNHESNSNATEKPTGDNGKTQHRNRLADAKSPYLLQHADNPVDWYPWGPEAFETARKEDKPVFLSIGYSTCHWCHVMEHESFEDPEVARLLNEAFVCVKVDREERPDIDNIYMTVCQMMTGGGGWPLTILMTADKKPFFAGTYFPKESRFGRIGMMDLVPSVRDAWKTQREKLLASAGEITGMLEKASVDSPGDDLGTSTLQAAYSQLSRRFDSAHGGFGDAPKFPTPHNLLFLLRHWKRTGDKAALEMVETTLQAMRRGGIYDHVGFGFHRYSTDAMWLLPHFEKMLYDQAQLVLAYAEAYQATGKQEYRETAEEILTYVLRDLRSPDGAFYSAEDADSEGEEGKFYVWTVGEVRTILGERADLIISVFNFEKAGNFTEQATGEKTGENIAYLEKPVAAIAAERGLDEKDLRDRIERARRDLFAVRERRIRPHRDEKVLADWNGLMVGALARAARVFDKPECAEAARQAVRFVLENLRRSDGRLLHRYYDGHADVPGYVDDYAFVVWGLLELYETTFDVAHLQTAIELNDQLIEHFWDEDAGGFYFTANDAEELIARPKEVYDGAVPSGNSVAMLNLLRLGRITGNAELEQKAARLARAFSGGIARAPMAHTQLLLAVDFGVGPAYEVVVAGDSQAGETGAMLRALALAFVPNKVVLLRRAEQKTPDISAIAEFTKSLPGTGGKATAYVCRDFACNLPTTDIDEMLKQLHARSTKE